MINEIEEMLYCMVGVFIWLIQAGSCYSLEHVYNLVTCVRLVSRIQMITL